MKERKKLEKELAKARKEDQKNKNGLKSAKTRELETLLEAHDKTIEKVQAKAIGMPEGMNSSLSSSGIPLITFEEGKIKTRNITSAVPVVIVGEETALNLFNQGKTELEELKDLSEDKNPYNKYLNENLEKMDELSQNIDEQKTKLENSKSKKEADNIYKLDNIK